MRENEVPLLTFWQEASSEVQQKSTSCFPKDLYFLMIGSCYLSTAFSHYHEITYSYINHLIYLFIYATSLWTTSRPNLPNKNLKYPLAILSVVCCTIWSQLENIKSLQDLRFDKSLADFRQWAPPAQISLGIVSSLILINSLYHIYLARKEYNNRYCIKYTIAWLTTIGGLTVLPIYYSVHLHHWIICYILVNFCRFSNALSLIIHFAALGILAEAITLWGPDRLIVGH